MLFFLVSSLLFTLLYSTIWITWKKNRYFYLERIDRFSPARRRRRIAEQKGEMEKPAEKKAWRREILRAVGRWFAGKNFVEKWADILEQADFKLRAEEFFALRLLVGIGLLLIASILRYPFPFQLLAFLIGFFAAAAYLKQKRKQRLERVSQQLPAALGTMSNAMRAGFSFVQAMQMIGKEVPDPLGPEFNQTIRELNLGISPEIAFGNLSRRLPDDDLRIVIAALLVQRTTGGNLSEMLESIQETIQERIRIKEELRTLTAQGRISAWVITGLPVILGLLFHLINPEYFSPLLQHPLGWFMIGMGVVFMLIGWMAIQKINRIEV